MSGFEFVFTLFGLVLGLALAEALSGLARAIKASDQVRIGWPTALLGLFVACDVVTFWIYGWALRDIVEINWPTMFGGFVITAIYYICAALVFPDDADGWADLDSHFDKHRQKILAGIFFCNAVLMATVIALFAVPSGFRAIIVAWSFFPVAGLAIVTKNRRIAVACLIWLLCLYPLSAFWN